MDKCPGLIGGLNDPSTSCNIESAINEVIDGVLDELPGNNPIGQWGADAAPAPAPAPVASSKSPVASAPAVSTPESSPDSTPEAPAPTPKTTSKNAAQPVVTAKPTKIVDPAPSSPAEVYTMSPAPSAAASAPVVGWSYSGCFADSRDRVMTGIKLANIGNHQVTNTKCVAYCESRGFSMAGTEYGGQCFCANSLSPSTPVDDGKCDMPCEGDESQTCGGGMTLSVYSKGGSKKRDRHLRRHLHHHS